MRVMAWCSLALGVALCVLSLRPAFIDVHDDAYPFSTYPMFASKRKAPVLALALGVDKDGEETRLSTELLGTDEVMQAAATLKRALRKSSKARQLCREIAERARAGSQWQSLEQIRLVRAQYAPLDYFAKGPTPQRTKLVARCAVHPPKKKSRGERK